MNEFALEWIVGAAMIAYHAVHRFNTPASVPGLTGMRSCRGTTTLGRFATFLSLYVATFLVLYWLLCTMWQTSPQLLRLLLKIATMRNLRGGSGGNDASVTSAGPSAATGAVDADTTVAVSGPPESTSAGSPALPHDPLEALPDDQGGLSVDGPLLVALTLTTLLPTVPWLRRFDTWLLRVFWTLGHIPSHVYRQTDRLLRASYNLPPVLREDVASRARALGLTGGDQRGFFECNGALAQWRNVAGLMLVIENWRDVPLPRYARFISDFETEFQALKTSFSRLSSRVKQLEDWHRTESDRRSRTDDSQTDTLDLLDEQRRRNGEERAEIDEFSHELSRRLCGFIVRAIFSVEVSESGRRKALARAGFDQNAILVESFTALQIATLITVVSFAFWFLSLVEAWLECVGAGAACDSVRMPALFVVAIMASTYGIGTLAGVLPASLLDRYGGLGRTERIVMGYALAGVFALFGAFVATVSVRYTANAFAGYGDAAYSQAQNLEKLAQAIGWSYPYLLQPIAIAFAMTGLVGLRRRFRQSRRPVSPVRDALIVGGAMFAASLIAYVLINGIGNFEGSRDPGYAKDVLVLFVIKGTLVGALIGWLAPSWYRRNRNVTPFQSLQEFVTTNELELASDAAQLEYGELSQVLLTAAASVAMADGHLDNVEQDHLLRALRVIHAGGVLDQKPESLVGGFVERCQALQDVHVRKHERALEALRLIRGRRRLASLTVHLAIAVAYADGWFESEEHDAVQRIIAMLRLNQSGFDLYPTRHGGNAQPRVEGHEAESDDGGPLSTGPEAEREGVH